MKRLHLSKVKTSKYYDSGCLVVFYLVSLIWGVNLIAKVGEAQLSNRLSFCLSVFQSVHVCLSAPTLSAVFFSVCLFACRRLPVFSPLTSHLSCISPFTSHLSCISPFTSPLSTLPSLLPSLSHALQDGYLWSWSKLWEEYPHKLMRCVLYTV